MVKTTFVLLAMLLGFSTQALAQNPYSVAYRVNESIVSYYDIDQRMKLMRVLGTSGSNLRNLATEGLIDDRLKVDAARGFGLEANERDINNAIAGIARQRNMTESQFRRRMRSAGVSTEALEDFAGTTVLWRTILRSRFGSMAQPSEIDLNTQLNTIATSSSSAIQLGEIILLYQERGQEGTTTLANQIIAQLRNGAEFSGLARQFSRSRTAEDGGVVGWVSPSRLPPQIKASIRGLGRGDIAEPVFIPTGIVILAVLNTRSVTRQIEIPTKISVSYAQMIIPHAPGEQAQALRLADRLRRSLDGCRGVDALAANYAQGSGLVATTRLRDVPADIGLALARLDPRDSTALTESNAVRVVVLCDRTSEMTTESRDILRNRLYAQNLSAMSQGYLLELRRTSRIKKK